MKIFQNTPKTLRAWIGYVVLGSLSFLGFVNHVFNFWERPALIMAFLFLGGTVLFTVISRFILSRRQIKKIPKKRFFFFILISILIGSFAAWNFHNSPKSYQKLTITPSLQSGQRVGLFEVKGNSVVVPVHSAAQESGWQEEQGIYYATPKARSLTLVFERPAGSSVTILFLTSPDSGEVNIEFNHATSHIDLNDSSTGQMGYQFVSSYRGFPNWIIQTLIYLADIVMVGLLVFLLLILQEAGELASRHMGTAPNRFFWRDIGFLLVVGAGLHILNALAVPLILGGDSWTYIKGAVHLVENGNFDGVSTSVGPGSTIFFAPALWLFGTNPWGLKVLLHLIALASIPLGYWLGWQLSKNRFVAFVSGLAIAISPDIFFYANFPMSDMLNIFLVLLFCGLFLWTLEGVTFYRMLVFLLSGSLAALMRSENILLIVIGAILLAVFIFWDWLKGYSLETKRAAFNLIIALLVASLPVLWWFNHNLKNHGFFGMSNYMGVVLYDGWVYFGDASNLSFSDPDSLAIQKIQGAIGEYPAEITDKKGVPTGWEIYPSLLKAGNSASQSMDLLKTAALDSIRNNPELTIRLLNLKINTGLEPVLTHDVTYSLPGELTRPPSVYFDQDNLSIPALIRLQRSANKNIYMWYPHIHPVWTMFCVLALVLSSIRRPLVVWAGLAAIVATRIFIPLSMSVPFWRYTLSGWFPLQILTFSWILVLARGVKAIQQKQSQ